MACSDYKSLLDAYAHGTLPEDQAPLVEDHLAECEECKKRVALLRMRDEAVASALLTGSRRGHEDEERRRPLRVVLVIAVVSVILMVGLYLFYIGLEKRLPAHPPLGRSALLSVDRQPLTRVLEEIGNQTGARVNWVREKDPEPRVTIHLVQPVRVRSLVSLLTTMHGARFLVAGKTPPQPSPEDSAALREKVDASLVTFNFGSIPLREALAYIRSVKAVNVVLHPAIPVETLVARCDRSARNEPLPEALDGLLEPHGLKWSVAHEVILIELR